MSISAYQGINISSDVEPLCGQDLLHGYRYGIITGSSARLHRWSVFYISFIQSSEPKTCTLDRAPTRRISVAPHPWFLGACVSMYSVPMISLCGCSNVNKLKRRWDTAPASSDNGVGFLRVYDQVQFC
jgi:hypothetical protein